VDQRRERQGRARSRGQRIDEGEEIAQCCRSVFHGGAEPSHAITDDGVRDGRLAERAGNESAQAGRGWAAVGNLGDEGSGGGVCGGGGRAGAASRLADLFG
jgi:hypothetical protein